MTPKILKKASSKAGSRKTAELEKTREKQRKSFETYVRRVSGVSERPYIREMLIGLIQNNLLNLDLLEFIPAPPAEIGKTRFDQLYDVAMSLVFPGYREETLERLLGPTHVDRPNTKIWRCIFPERFGLTHVMIRASSFQEAFALASDYACRLSLRMYRRIPTDLTVRIQFVSEKALRRTLDMRWANRVKKRKQLQMEGREFSSKEITGARMAAIGHKKQDSYDIFHYAEARDLKRILQTKNLIRISSVETETFQEELPNDYKFRTRK